MQILKEQRDAGEDWGKRFPVLVDSPFKPPVPSVVAVVHKVVGAAIFYTYHGQGGRKVSEVEEWVRRWKRGLETRALITDKYVSRGWEAKELLVVIEGQLQLENLVMRTYGFCFLIRIDKISFKPVQVIPKSLKGQSFIRSTNNAV